LEGPGAGSDSVVLAVTPPTGTWTASTNATWLHLSPANQSGAGSMNVIFSFDANPGATRFGSLTIGGQMLSVTQAGSTYVHVPSATVLVSSGLSKPMGVAGGQRGRCLHCRFRELDPTDKVESAAAGNDSLPVVVPATANLSGPFAPTSDQPWLTITGITNGVVSFSFSANSGLPRLAHINLLGQPVAVTQVGPGPPQILAILPGQGNGVLQFAFGDTENPSFAVLSTTDLTLPASNWTVAGAATNTAPGLFQFTTQAMSNDAQRFFIVRTN
jgi:hypothetical protein